MEFGFATEYPPNILAEPDMRQTYRNVVAGALRRSLGDIADEAAEASSDYPDIAAGYDVVQASTGDLALGIVNHHPHWVWVEYPTVPHFPPYQDDSELMAWVIRKGMDRSAAFLVARQISREGTTGHGYLTEAWDAGRDTIIEALYAAISRWWNSWGVWDGE